MTPTKWFVGLLLGLFAALSLAATTNAEAGTLDKVRARGHLVCGSVDPLPGFAQKGKDGLWSGFDVDFCRAVAAAVLGDPNLVIFRSLSGDARFANLQTGDLDLIARNAPWTMSRDNLFGVEYLATSFYDGLAFMVPQKSDVVSAYELKNVKICLVDNPDQVRAVENLMFETQADYTEKLYEDRQDLGVAYKAGICDVVAAPASWLHALQRSLPEPASQRILPERITKQPLGPVVREGDDEWADIVRWTLFVLIDAEELGVTSANIEPMLATKNPDIRRLLGADGDFGKSMGLAPQWMRKVIASVGNYGEIYARNFGSQTGVPLARGLNSLWTKGGLLYGMPIR